MRPKNSWNLEVRPESMAPIILVFQVLAPVEPHLKKR